MTTRIIFNGKEYSGPEAMPPDVRRAYEQTLAFLADSNRNGVPDVMEGKGSDLGSNVISLQQSHIVFNGKTYGGPAEMPAAVRRLYEQVMAEVNAKRIGDASEQPSSTQAAPVEPNSAPPVTSIRGFKPHPLPGSAPSSARRSLELILYGVILGAVAALVASYFLLSSQ